MKTPMEFWSDTSGNQGALMECLKSLTNAASGAPSVNPVVLVEGESGSGATALARQVAKKIRETGRKVLSVEKSSPVAADDFCANLDASLAIPEGLSKRLGCVTPALGEVQLAVLDARSYGAIIVHDFEKYVFDSDSASAQSNLSALSHLIRLNTPRAVMVYGTPKSIGALHLSLNAACIEHRMLTLAPMRCDARFGHFITSVALRLGRCGVEDLIERLDVETLYQRSGGKVGLAVTLLAHDLTEALAQKDASVSLSMLEPGSPAASARLCQDFDEYEPTCAGSVDVDLCNEPDEIAQAEHGSKAGLYPVADESFSSWVARRGLDPSSSDDVRLANALSHHMQETGGDPDHAYALLHQLMNHLSRNQLSPSEHFRRVTPIDLPPFEQALNYCPACFESDLSFGISPAWRINWRRARACACTNHESPVLLERLATSRFSLLDKAWRAFAEYLASPASRLVSNFPLMHSTSASAYDDNLRLVTLATRVQQWFYRLSDSTSPSAKAAEFLLSYWLQDTSQSGAQGVARSYFFFRSNRPQAVTKKHLGEVYDEFRPDTATPRDTAVAYWMLGVSFGVITSEEAQFIRDATRPFVLSFPVTKDDVASLGPLAYGRPQRLAYLALAKTSLIPSDYKSIHWALQDIGSSSKPLM